MKLIKLRTKVLLTSEEQMEMQSEHDFGTFEDKDKKWVYRNTGVIASEIYRVVQYNKTKTLVEMFGGDKYLVDEPFDQVFEKWEKSKEDEDSFTSEEENEERTLNSDEEDEE